ncbi:MAG: hypothetical protein EBU08_18820, partial [Micrococcales bacterium]|nr:hypothetical protein [Micrococcales bacterium]
MNHNAIPALVGCGLMTAGGCITGGFGGYAIVHNATPVATALGTLMGAGVGGLAGGYSGAGLANAILRHGERREMRRMARMPIGQSEPT